MTITRSICGRAVMLGQYQLRQVLARSLRKGLLPNHNNGTWPSKDAKELPVGKEKWTPYFEHGTRSG